MPRVLPAFATYRFTQPPTSTPLLRSANKRINRKLLLQGCSSVKWQDWHSMLHRGLCLHPPPYSIQPQQQPPQNQLGQLDLEFWSGTDFVKRDRPEVEAAPAGGTLAIHSTLPKYPSFGLWIRPPGSEGQHPCPLRTCEWWCRWLRWRPTAFSVTLVDSFR